MLSNIVELNVLVHITRRSPPANQIAVLYFCYSAIISKQHNGCSLFVNTASLGWFSWTCLLKMVHFIVLLLQLWLVRF